jgi:hypothetical protein
MRNRFICMLVVPLLLVACEAQGPLVDRDAAAADAPAGVTLNAADIGIVDGRTVYVPVYSHLDYLIEGRVYTLSATLSVRNTDAARPITVERVDYFNSDGRLVQRFLEQPRVLAPMASTEFIVEQKDTRGGAGANFLVDWSADGEVYEPVIEAVMLGTAGTQGVAFVGRGRPYRGSREPESPTP